MRGMKRGFLRLYILKLIGAAPDGISGYALMKRIEAETGFWRPSPGSIYPLLAALEEAGLIRHRAEADKKIYFLTDKGREGLARARAAKDEAIEGVRRSIHVLGELFGKEVEEELTAHFDQVRRHIPPAIRESMHELWQAIAAIPSEGLTPEEIAEINAILARAIEELRKYAQRDRSH